MVGMPPRAVVGWLGGCGRLGEASVTMAMGGGPPLHRRPRGAGAAETTSWAVGGAPHMSSTPIWLVGHRGQAAIAATGVSGAALNSLFYRSRVQPRAVT